MSDTDTSEDLREVGHWQSYITIFALGRGEVLLDVDYLTSFHYVSQHVLLTLSIMIGRADAQQVFFPLSKFDIPPSHPSCPLSTFIFLFRLIVSSLYHFAALDASSFLFYQL